MFKEIYLLTEPELNRYRKLANFTEDELRCFNMKSKNYSIVKIAMSIGVSESTVSRLVRSVKNKMLRLDELKEYLNED